MGANRESIAAFVMVMDIRGFSNLPATNHYKIIEFLYPEIAKIVGVACKTKPLDKKTMGDGFIFYFDNPRDAIQLAMHTRQLFVDAGFWDLHEFGRPLSCRICLHFGQFFRMHDDIEGRDAIFGMNIITAARLEPVVRENEIWCTHSFKAETKVNDIDERIKFQPLGTCQLAKGWSQEEVYALYGMDDRRPDPIVENNRRRIIQYHNEKKEFPYTYFVLMQLKNRSDGVHHLKKSLSAQNFHIEAVYYVFGAFDVIIRFKTAKQMSQKTLSALLVRDRIIWPDEECEVTQLHLEDEGRDEQIVVFPPEDHQFLKAFIYLKSSALVADGKRVKRVINLARKAFGETTAVVTHYRNSDTLILPVVIPTHQYYALAKAIEDIEAWVDQQRSRENVSIITYPVHGFEEMFEKGANQ